MNPEHVVSSHVAPSFTQPLTWPGGKAAAIAYADNVFAGQFCDSLIAHCLANDAKAFPGKTMGGISPEIKTSVDWHLEQAEGVPENVEQELDKRVFDQLWRVLALYKNSVPQLRDMSNNDKCFANDSGYQIQLYKQNQGFYDEHIDGAPWVESAKTRTLGVVVYLNTVDQGGGTHFPMHNLTVGAVQGRVAMFPASWTHPHCGLMPLTSDKWIVSTFVNCNP